MLLENKVSIVMPTYNIGDIVVDSINSVIAQTYSDWELIIIDDCSSDHTYDFLCKMYSDESRISVFQTEKNSGAGVARNLGISKSSGRYLAFLDSDDIWLPQKLSKQIYHMRLHKAAISHTSYNFINNSGKLRRGFVKASKTVDLISNLKKTEIGTSTAIIDRFQISSVSFCGIRARQDLVLWIELLGKGFLSHGVSDVLVNYRVRDGSVSSNKLKMLLVTFKIYMGIKSISIYQRLYCYISYSLNALTKRII